MVKGKSKNNAQRKGLVDEIESLRLMIKSKDHMFKDLEK